MKTFQECKDEVARDAGYENFNLMYSFSDDLHINQDLEKAADLYAVAKLQDAPQAKEPTEEEIDKVAWMKYNEWGKEDATLTWIEAIEWYKQQIKQK